MHAAAFSLVSTGDPDQIVAFGLDIRRAEGENEATITYRREASGHDVITQHLSPEAAHALYDRITPVTLKWE